jgi:multisubunit Na+/H+ antiporter MnhB subunit
MKASEMVVITATVLLLVVGLRFAPNPRAEIGVVATGAVCGLIYVSYRWRRPRSH